MTATEAAMAVNLVGGRLVFELGRVGRLEAPAGVLGQAILDALAEHREELGLSLLTSRYDEVSQRIAAVYVRLDGHSPWEPDDIASARDLAEAMDLEAKRYMAGETAEPAAFLAALARWEHALVAVTRSRDAVPDASTDSRLPSQGRVAP